MSTITTDSGPGPLRIVLSGGNAARLFGIPFLLVGCWLGYYLVLNLVDLVTDQLGAEFIPGTLLLVVMTAAFFLPGWMLMVSRAVVEIDRMRGTVTATRDLRFYRHRSVRSLSQFSSIEVDVLTTSPNDKNTRAFQVELAAEDRKNQVVGLFDRGEDALDHGHRLGALLGLTVKDLRFVEREED